MGTIKLIIGAIFIAFASYYLGQKMADNPPHEKATSERIEKGTREHKEITEVIEPKRRERPSQIDFNKLREREKKKRADYRPREDSKEMLENVAEPSMPIIPEEGMSDDDDSDIREDRPDFDEPSKKIGSMMDEQDLADIERIEEAMPEEAAKLREAFRQRILSEREAIDISPEIEAESDDIAPLSEDEIYIDQTE